MHDRVRRDTPTKRRSRRPALALGAIAGVVGACGVGATLASASSPAQSGRAEHTTGPAALSGVERTLTRLESGAHGGTLSETGSSLFYPLLSTWAQSYRTSKVETASTGSGAGQSGALAGTVDIGASDAYLPPSDPAGLLDIPVVVSAQQIDYNVPGLSASTHLRLDAKVLNDIYTGQVTNWDSSAIAALNKGVKLPNLKIVPLRRSDSSGDTFLFSSYLGLGDSSSFVASSGPGTTVNWPNVASEVAAKGNSGMLALAERTRGSIAYIGISYLRSALKAGLGDAELLNGSGRYVLPTPANISAEVQSYRHIPASGAVSLVDSKSAPFGYPIVNFEYAIVQRAQASATTAAEIKAFLAWGMDPRHGSAGHYLAPVNFQALPSNGLAVALKLVESLR